MRTNSDFTSTYGPWAVVTGASSGIGVATAYALASQGLNVILVARRQLLLDTLAQDLAHRFGVEAIVVAADLTTPEGVAAVRTGTADYDVGLLVNNAGREDSGHFVGSDAQNALQTIDLNIRAPYLLAHHFAPKLVDRGRGGLVFLSSIVALQGVPYIANYAATKAYDLVLAESLASELEPRGVDVLAVAPGFTATNLSPDFDFSGMSIKPISPALVASHILRDLGRRRLSVPGKMNRFLVIMGKRVFSRRQNTQTFGKVFRKVLRRKLSARPKPTRTAA
ncbi:SDR family NAD(P)-dependent oxidoreductase [Roseobacter sp. YSTF-M11]|uniref:SDR family NAD(P)-dependent oxidoreductase n=1 Tax=Roseobacter insulae TaxID=2859783 RepID=A0A9X1FUQ7_9RHOB|nr:SDR family NAD(P)-dependent oxidoreductase [Roseobacter insulae]MBW4707470.1 SDR family NAD(P)-dependent oxidoreductase [Roseobacter insulae]